MFVVCLAGPEKKVIFGGGPKVGSLVMPWVGQLPEWLEVSLHVELRDVLTVRRVPPCSFSWHAWLAGAEAVSAVAAYH